MKFSQTHKPQRATKVVNLYNESYDVYAGSPQSGIDPQEIAPGQYGFLGNPYQDSCDHEESLYLFQEYFMGRLKSDRQFRLAVLSIRGKKLGCFCEHGERCHADIVADWLEGQRQNHIRLLGP